MDHIPSDDYLHHINELEDAERDPPELPCADEALCSFAAQAPYAGDLRPCPDDLLTTFVSARGSGACNETRRLLRVHVMERRQEAGRELFLPLPPCCEPRLPDEALVVRSLAPDKTRRWAIFRDWAAYQRIHNPRVRHAAQHDTPYPGDGEYPAQEGRYVEHPYTVFGVYEDDTPDPWYLGHVQATSPEAAARAALAEAGDDAALVVYAVVPGHHTDVLRRPTGVTADAPIYAEREAAATVAGNTVLGDVAYETQRRALTNMGRDEEFHVELPGPERQAKVPPSVISLQDYGRVFIKDDGSLGAVELVVAGFGTATMKPNFGPIAVLDRGGLAMDELKLYVWADIRSENPTHVIELAGASELRRQEE